MRANVTGDTLRQIDELINDLNSVKTEMGKPSGIRSYSFIKGKLEQVGKKVRNDLSTKTNIQYK